MKGGAIRTNEKSSSTGWTTRNADAWYLFKKNNPSADNPITEKIETAHMDYLALE